MCLQSNSTLKIDKWTFIRRGCCVCLIKSICIICPVKGLIEANRIHWFHCIRKSLLRVKVLYKDGFAWENLDPCHFLDKQCNQVVLLLSIGWALMSLGTGKEKHCKQKTCFMTLIKCIELHCQSQFRDKFRNIRDREKLLTTASWSKASVSWTLGTVTNSAPFFLKFWLINSQALKKEKKNR